MRNRKLCMLLCMMLALLIIAGCKNEADKKQDNNAAKKTETEKTENISETKGDGGETKNSETASEAETETTDATDNTQGTEATDPSADTKATQEQTTEPSQTVEDITTGQTAPEYSYTDMSVIMYAVSDVNVRSAPSVDGQRIGSLSGGQEISVTGQCNETGWYRINFNEQPGYVSNNYLGTEKPTEKPTEKQTEKPSTQTPDTQKPPEQTGPNGLVSPGNLANIKSLKKRCSDEEFEAAYNVAVNIVTPLIGLSREEQLMGIASAIRDLFDSGKVQYSVEAPHYDDPYGYFVTGVGSCAGCARATGLCLNMLNIPYEHVNENQWSHQWCRINIDGTYWICDAYGLYVGPEPVPYVHPYLN